MKRSSASFRNISPDFFRDSFCVRVCVFGLGFFSPQPSVPVFAEWVFGDSKKRVLFFFPLSSSKRFVLLSKWQAGDRRRWVEPKIIPPVLFRFLHLPFATTTTTTRWRDGRCPNMLTWSSAKNRALERGTRELLLENLSSTICGFKLPKWALCADSCALFSFKCSRRVFVHTDSSSFWLSLLTAASIYTFYSTFYSPLTFKSFTPMFYSSAAPYRTPAARGVLYEKDQTCSSSLATAG